MTTLQDIQAAIEAQGAGWQAADTAIWRGRPEVSPQGARRFGLNLTQSDPTLIVADSGLGDLVGAPLPDHIDWREQGRVSAVKDQGICGSCVAFAVCAAMESDHWIRTDTEVSLSEGHLFFCAGASCDVGWDFGPALSAAHTQGVGSAADLPYDAAGSCIDIATVLKVSAWRAATTTVSRKRALTRGPVIAGMAVYDDFLAYSGGVYRHVAGADSAYHAVCVVGYDDRDGCWLVKNSWGPGFGENGFFRIAYGECEIDQLPFFSVETAAA